MGVLAHIVPLVQQQLCQPHLLYVLGEAGDDEGEHHGDGEQIQLVPVLDRPALYGAAVGGRVGRPCALGAVEGGGGV